MTVQQIKNELKAITAAVAAGAFCWMVKYTVLKEADMIVIAAFLWLWVACKLLVWINHRNTHVA